MVQLLNFAGLAESSHKHIMIEKGCVLIKTLFIKIGSLPILGLNKCRREEVSKASYF